jgi:hypothetical protein
LPAAALPASKQADLLFGALATMLGGRDNTVTGAPRHRDQWSGDWTVAPRFLFDRQEALRRDSVAAVTRWKRPDGRVAVQARIRAAPREGKIEHLPCLARWRESYPDPQRRPSLCRTGFVRINEGARAGSERQRHLLLH